MSSPGTMKPVNTGDPNNPNARNSFDWISGHSALGTTEFQESILATDWDNSPLGPISQWPLQLKQMVLLVSADPNPAAVCWGSSPTTIRNEAYTSLLDPKLAPSPDHISDLIEDWYEIESVLRKQRGNGIAVIMPRQFTLIRRQGMLEEAYFTWRFTPIIDSSGCVVGTHVTGVNITHEMVATRRLETVESLTHAIAAAETTKELWSQILTGLQHSAKDIPLALLYSVDHSTLGPRSLPAAERPRYSAQPLTCTLEGTIGNPIDQLKAPVSFHLSQNESWLAASFNKALETGGVVHLSHEHGTMPMPLLVDTEKHVHGSSLSRIIICPLNSSRLGPVRGFLVLALASETPNDDEYQRFVRTLLDQVAIAQVVAMTLDDEARKRDIPAGQDSSDKTTLSQELQTRILEVEEGEKKLARFTARAQVALGILDAKGTVVFANPLWRELTQLDAADDQVAWAKAIVPEDLDETYAIFARMIAEASPIDFHLRFNKRWKAPGVDKNGGPIYTDTHIICSLFPDLDEDGNVTTTMSCLTDISELKWVESQLRQRTADVEHREAMWRNFTDHAPIGLCLINSDGSLEFGNDTWWTMTQTPSDEKSGLAWVRKSVVAEDIPQVEEMFRNSLDHDAPKTLEFRLNRLADRSHPAVLEHSNTLNITLNITLLVTVHTTLDLDGSVQHLVVWLTDITAQKLAENDLRNRMDQAIHMKRQQEKFIDMTSHELRNPLSAMVHCADEIVSVLNKYVVSNAGELVEDAIEAADTIMYCAMHQKRIVDDILTLSRLDSDLLVISPVPAILKNVIRQALKMFEAELKRAKITVHLHENDSLGGKNLWTIFDPGRVLQIFVNLMTNAIKFTRSEKERQIRIEIGASHSKPVATDQETKYIPKREITRDQTNGLEWGSGEPVYLSISVADTGRGLTTEEKELLFNVFQQASPKTYVQYGGSGLGLFISRQLVEMQGGEIGVASKAGRGSTFSCYIKARRTQAPAESLPNIQEPASFMDAEALREASGGDIPSQRSRKDIVDRLAIRSKSIDRSLNGSMPDGKFHILVVEDNLINQKVVAKQLRHHGCIVNVANHGIEALAFIRRSEHYVGFPNGEKLSVILMDLEMPVMNGLTCVKEIRQAQLQGQIRSHIPIIAITANARADQIAEAMDAGTDHVITKPYRIPDIISQVENLLERLRTSNDIR